MWRGKQRIHSTRITTKIKCTYDTKQTKLLFRILFKRLKMPSCVTCYSITYLFRRFYQPNVGQAHNMCKIGNTKPMYLIKYFCYASLQRYLLSSQHHHLMAKQDRLRNPNKSKGLETSYDEENKDRYSPTIFKTTTRKFVRQLVFKRMIDQKHTSMPIYAEHILL